MERKWSNNGSKMARKLTKIGPQNGPKNGKGCTEKESNKMDQK